MTLLLLAIYLVLTIGLLRRFSDFMGLALGIFMIRPNFFQWTLITQIAGVNVCPADVLYAALATFITVKILGRSSRARKGRGLPRYFTIFFIWAILGVSRGIPIHGPSAIGESRLYILPMLVFLALWMGIDRSAARSELSRIFKISVSIFLIAAAIRTLVFVSEVLTGARLMSRRFDFRFLSAYRTLGLLVLMLYTLSAILIRKSEHRRLYLISTIALAGMIVFLQHRSVWVGMVVGTVILFGLFGRQIKTVITVVTIAIVIYSLMLITNSIELPLSFEESLTESAAFLEDPTLDRAASWRLLGWATEFSVAMETPILGQGYGGYSEWVDPLSGEITTTQVHNGYIMLFSKLGLIGVLLFLSMLLTVLRRCYRHTKRASDINSKMIWAWLMSIVAANAAFTVFYYETLISWSFLAVAMILSDSEPIQPVTEQKRATDTDSND